jgi:hypothetical protein
MIMKLIKRVVVKIMTIFLVLIFIEENALSLPLSLRGVVSNEPLKPQTLGGAASTVPIEAAATLTSTPPSHHTQGHQHDDNHGSIMDDVTHYEVSIPRLLSTAAMSTQVPAQVS